MISLSPDAHRYHWSGSFALKRVKISKDKKCLIVKFYWLPKIDGPLSSSVSKLCDSPPGPSVKEDPYQGPGLARLFNHAVEIDENKKVSDAIFKSGDEIQLKTKDPENCPLPCWELLEMQWLLNRVVAMSGDVDIDVEDGFDYYQDFQEEDVDKNSDDEDGFVYDDDYYDGYYDDGYYDDDQVSMTEAADFDDPCDMPDAFE